MDNGMFKSYKFKPSDVIEGLNRYFAETKANRYRRAPLEIKNGTVKPGNYYVFRNLVFDAKTPKIKECGYYYVICYPEEVVGVAINWLREEHDIFYTPGMEAPVEDFDVDDAAKEYEQATRKDKVKYYSEKDLREALGIAEDSDIFQCIKYRDHQLEILRTEVAAARRMYNRANNDRSYFGKRLADIRKAAGMADDNPTDLVKYVDQLREKADEQQKKIDSYEEVKALYAYIYGGSDSPEEYKLGKEIHDKIFGMAEQEIEARTIKALDDVDVRGLSLKIEELEEACHRKDHILSEQTKRLNKLVNLRLSILQVYREIFDCSNGDPEGSDKETLQDILTEYKRTLELKNAAEEKTIKYKELAKENDEKAAKYKVRLDNAERQLRWTEEVSSKRLEKYEKLKSELDGMPKLRQKLAEIKDICER